MPKGSSPFEGVWVHRKNSAEVVETFSGGQLLWHSGEVTDVVLDGDDGVSTHVAGEEAPRRAQLLGDRLVWDNGVVWVRLEAPSAGEEEEDDLGEDAPVPSDEDDRRPKPPAQSSAGPLGCLADFFPEEEEIAPLPLQALRDEQEWLERKRLTGAVGRLVRYKEGQSPADDIQGLCLTRQGRIMVTALHRDGPAARAGVTQGDQLASIDGKSLPVRRPASTILTNVKAPVTLVFLGFAGKLQAEVRVRQPDQPQCGLPAGSEISTRLVPGKANLRLAEAVIFEQQADSIFITTMPPRDPTQAGPVAPKAGIGGSGALTMPSPLSIEAQGSMGEGEEDVEVAKEDDKTEPLSQRAKGAVGDEGRPLAAQEALYELQREDAKRMLKRALHSNMRKASLCTI